MGNGECGNHHEVVAGAMVMVHVSWNALSTRGSTRYRGCRSGACGRHSGRWCSRNRTPAGTRPKESTRCRTSAPGSARTWAQRSAPQWAPRWARPSAPRRAQEYRRHTRTILGSARSAPWSRPAPATAQARGRLFGCWNQKPNSQSNFCFPCYGCVLLPETLVLLVSVTLARNGGLGCNIQAV